MLLHQVRPGAASRSFGVQVARLAGVPAEVLARARAVLASLERTQLPAPAADTPQMPLFGGGADQLHALLAETDPDALSPREALDLLYRLKGLAG